MKYELIDEIDKALKQTTSDKKSNNFLLQRISNAASFFSTIPQFTEKLDEIYYVICYQSVSKFYYVDFKVKCFVWKDTSFYSWVDGLA